MSDDKQTDNDVSDVDFYTSAVTAKARRKWHKECGNVNNYEPEK